MAKDFLIWFLIFWPVGYFIGIPIYIKYIKNVEVQKIITMIRIIIVIILFILSQTIFIKCDIALPFGIITGVLFGSAFSHISFKKKQTYKDENPKMDK